MSAAYDLVPLTRVLSKPKQMEWLEGMGLALPKPWTHSRHPTPAEVRAALAELTASGRLRIEEEFHIAGDDLEASLATGEVTGEVTEDDQTDQTILSICDYAKARDETAPHRVQFQYGEAPIVLMISEYLSRACGPFLLSRDWAFFTIVEPGTNGNAQWGMTDF